MKWERRRPGRRKTASRQSWWQWWWSIEVRRRRLLETSMVEVEDQFEVGGKRLAALDKVLSLIFKTLYSSEQRSITAMQFVHNIE